MSKFVFLESSMDYQNPAIFTNRHLRHATNQMSLNPLANLFIMPKGYSPYHRPVKPSPLDHYDKYKTEMCISYMEHGKCDQPNCQFAHGEHELRPVVRDPNYKTILCKNFHSANGFCRHGSRCTYIHNEPSRLAKVAAFYDDSSSPFKTDSMFSGDGRRSISDLDSNVSRSGSISSNSDDEQCNIYADFENGS